jgi:soluble lytic murein transglycosylase-like protein
VNLAAGAAYLKSLQRRYGDNLPLILAAYNAGEGAVARYHRRIPPYRETAGYVSGVLGRYRQAIVAPELPDGVAGFTAAALR